MTEGKFCKLVACVHSVVGHCRLYYRRVEEGKQYPVLCRRLASLNDEFISHKHPSAGFDFTTGKRIEQKLVDYNQEGERFGGNASYYLFLGSMDIDTGHTYIQQLVDIAHLY